MTVNRSAVTMVLIFVTSVMMLAHTKDVTTLEYDDLLPTNETNARHNIDTESPVGDHRQGRMSLQAEPPSSKAKREQALRGILAARRRRILSQRAIESRNLSRTPRPVDGKDSSPDVLEAQETRHGMYVTAPAAGKPEDGQTPGRIAVPESSSTDAADIEFASKELAEKRENARNQSVPVSNVRSSVPDDPASNSAKGDRSIGHRSFLSSPSFSSSTVSSSSVPSGQKFADQEARKKNIVSMPDSLYNYFRPVESNIPVEDMSQFLYFGQKIQPEARNGTGNDSTDATRSTASASPGSRRRYSAKRLGATTPGPVPSLEEMVDEEMNIAVERRTVEKNKVSKIKNAFRSPENGLRYGKIGPTEAMLAPNVVATTETGDADSGRVEFRYDDSSARADTADRLLHGGGSAAAHVAVETGNTTDATRTPYRQPVSADASARTREESETTAEVVIASEPRNVSAGSTSNVLSAREGKDDDASAVSLDQENTANPLPGTDTEMYGEPTEKKTRRIDFYGNAEETRADQTRGDNRGEGNGTGGNVETSTSRETMDDDRSTTESFRIAWTSPETSSLRIVVTDGSVEDRFAIGADVAERYTVKPVDSTVERVRSVASGDVPTPNAVAPSGTGSTSTESLAFTISPPVVRPKSRHREQKQRQPPPRPTADGNRDPHRHHRQREQEQRQQQRKQQQQQQHRHRQHQRQQHVYAYTITNVTRLLRNYTGPGLSGEEQGGPERSTGTTEITTGSAQRRRPPLPPSLLLPRAGSGIEAGRAPAKLSAGTTVEPVAAGEPSVARLVGERQRKVVALAPPQSQERAVDETSPPQLTTVNKTGPGSAETTTATTEGNGGGAARWNPAESRTTDPEGFGDRRYLRKSASAVLNQRIGAGPDDEAALPFAVVGKRRRVTNGRASNAGRRLETAVVAEVSNGERVSIVAKTAAGLVGDEANFDDRRNAEDAADGRGYDETKSIDANRAIEHAALERTTAKSVAMQQRVLSTAATPFGPFADEGTTIEPATPQTFANDTEQPGDTENDAKEKNAGPGSEIETTVAAVVPDESGGSATEENGGENGGGSPTVTVTATLDRTIVPKETTTAAPLPAPMFPVTPRMIAETARPPIDRETFTAKPSDAKPTESDKPFGMANLDPSEIQKMYRSRNATTAATATTTEVSTTTARIEISPLPRGESATTAEPRKRLSSERSPEVRGRNLSDKTQDAAASDKDDDDDDVLPIMHLYNTSDIFNGTGPVNAFPRGTERRAELSTNRPVDVSGTVETASETTTARASTSDAHGATRVPETARKDRQEETTAQVPPTGPGRGSSNGNRANRTRHRPAVYHPAILPEYNSTVYSTELNRTLFDSGLVSVSPRESVNISEVISKRHDGDAIASQETVAVVGYILATLLVFPIAVGVGLILRRLILRNRKVLEESDTSSEISCRKDALNLENGDFKTSIEKAITKLPRIQHLCHEAEKPPPPPSQESRWEFPRDKLRLQTVLGQGNFGQVWKAEADDLTGHQGTTRLVAVKTVKEGASEREKEDLVRELEIMQQLGSHPNVVTLLGCCTEQEPHYLILEYVMYGKLLAYLRDHRTRQDFYNFSEDSAALTSRDLTVFGYCVARGMEYLASKKIIHRDLAARNVLVDHNKLCKIADFGMSRFANEDGEVIETRHGRNALPIRWMAPESLIYSLFTAKTDVWSFGILMWEIVTLGSTPYPDMTAREVMRNVQNGYRLERPSHCRSELFRVISRCWHADPDRRPEFQTLRRDLAQLLEDNMNGHYVDLESFASECTD